MVGRPRKQAPARELFPNMSSDVVNPAPSRMTKEDTRNMIDAVMKSNMDDQTKQRMVSNIQRKYRQNRDREDAARSAQPQKQKPRNQKQYKD